MTHHTDPMYEMDDDTPESVACAIMRCPGCGMVHITMIDDDDEPITEMTLGDGDVLALALQLLRAVYPSIDSNRLMKQIGSATEPRH